MNAKRKPARKAGRPAPKKRSAPASARRRPPPRAKQPAPARPKPLGGAYADFMVQAYAMEIDAVERYTEFAEQMEVHNNREVAQLFRKLARIEGLHAGTIIQEMGWKRPPARTEAWMWRDSEAPESAPGDALHYLMQPYHALQLALECEERAASFFSGIVRSTAPAEVKRVAREMAAEEREHVRLIREWLKKVDKPDADWDRDPDPPYYSE